MLGQPGGLAPAALGPRAGISRRVAADQGRGPGGGSVVAAAWTAARFKAGQTVSLCRKQRQAARVYLSTRRAWKYRPEGWCWRRQGDLLK